MELDTQRVWDYAGDGYVHRLIQNKTDGKLVELPSPMQTTDYREPEKINKIVTEYNYLLMSQLECQRVYYEELLAKAMSEGFGDRRCAELQEKVNKLTKTNNQQNTQIKQLKDKLLDVIKENKFLKDINNALESDQKKFGQVLKKHMSDAAAKSEAQEARMRELEEQVRDLMFALEGQKMVAAADEGKLEEGSVLKIPKQGVPKPPVTPKKNNNNNSKKKKKK